MTARTFTVSEAGARQERVKGIELLADQPRRPHQTVGADKGYDVGPFVTPCRDLGVTPHVASRKAGSRIDQRAMRHDGYRISQRKRVEEPFGWMKTFGLLHKLRHRGKRRYRHEPVSGPLHVSLNLIQWLNQTERIFDQANRSPRHGNTSAAPSTHPSTDWSTNGRYVGLFQQAARAC